MTTALQGYSNIKSCLQNNLNLRSDKGEILNKIKCTFKSDIKSPRKLERIQTLSELMIVLEKRNCISEKQINRLKVISEGLGNPNGVLEAIYRYQNSIVGGIEVSHEKQLYEVLVQGLGRHYRDFARYLGVEESQLEIIDITYPTEVASRIWKLLDVCNNKFINFDVYFQNICNALRKCRRNDLVDKLTSIRQSNM